jgi:hypothetical protein
MELSPANCIGAWYEARQAHHLYSRMSARQMREYLEMLQDAICEVNPPTGPTQFGAWRCNFTKPLSIDYCYGYPKYNHNFYEIELSRINTLPALIHWIDHLHSKTWFNTDYNATANDPESAMNFFRVVATLHLGGEL